jgi:transcriptional regulator CtsR
VTEVQYKSIFHFIYSIGGSYTILLSILSLLLSYSIIRDQETSLLESILDKPQASYMQDDLNMMREEMKKRVSFAGIYKLNEDVIKLKEEFQQTGAG